MVRQKALRQQPNMVLACMRNSRVRKNGKMLARMPRGVQRELEFGCNSHKAAGRQLCRSRAVRRYAVP